MNKDQLATELRQKGYGRIADLLDLETPSAEDADTLETAEDVAAMKAMSTPAKAKSK